MIPQRAAMWVVAAGLTMLLLGVGGSVAAQPQPTPLYQHFCDSVTEIPWDECEALVALYESTNGPGWRDNTGWLQTNTPCSWYGVRCEEGHVQELFLGDNALTGAIPLELGNLTRLERLGLSGNRLNGAIPPNLPGAEKYLSDNELTGSIPVGACGGLYVDLSNNRITGTIPPECCAAYLNLANNQLSGDIPPELGNCRRMEALNLAGNQLTGSIPDLRETNLSFLNLSDNQLTGDLSGALSRNITSLYVANNHLSGDLNSLSGADHLMDLDLAGNELSGEIPVWIGTLKDLRTLSLSRNRLYGQLPAELGNLTKLSDLRVDGNSLGGPLPNSFQNLRLDRFWFNSTEICEPQDIWVRRWLNGILDLRRTGVSCGAICDAVTEIPRSECEALVALYGSAGGPLWTHRDGWLSTNTPCSWYGVTCADGHVVGLGLASNGLRGELPIELGNLSNLEWLRINDNALRSELPKSLGGLPLTSFWFDNTDLCEPGRLSFQSWLEGIDDLHRTGTVCGCQWIEDIPVSECAALVTLYEDTNGSRWWYNEGWLSGSRACEWQGVGCEDGHVTVLNVWGSEGAIPPDVGALTELRELSVYGGLGGNIPPEVGSLTHLQVLRLGPPPGYESTSQLGGTIPPEIGNLEELRILELSNNPLGGSLPLSLVGLPLERLWLDGTDVCEPDGESLQEWLESIPDLRRSGLPCTFAGCDAVTEIPRSECEALVALYNGTEGHTWTHSRGWLTTNTPCNWYGVTCAEGHVSGLSLPFNNLRGSLPGELGNLSELRTLTLSANELIGTLPS